MTLEDKAKKLMDAPGDTREEVVKSYMTYIENKEKEEGRKKVEEEMKKLGYPVNFKEINPLAWVKEGLTVLILLVAKETFNWTEEDIFNMGKEEPKLSFITKMLMKYFVSLEKSLEAGPKYWKKFYNFGSLEVTESNKEEKYFIIRISGYDFDPIMCKYHAGFFLTMSRFIIKGENVSIKETKCVYKGSDYHEYVISWQ